MLKNLMMGTAALALSVGAMTGAANAGVFRFHAHLSPLNEVGSSPLLTGSGVGVMFYDDGGTVGVIADDSYRIRITFTPLGTTALGAPLPNPTVQITQAHNHLGVRGTNGSVIQDLDAADGVPPPNESPLDSVVFLPVTGSIGAGAGLNFFTTLAEPDEQGAPTSPGAPIPGNSLYTDADVVANLLSYAYGTNDDGRLPNAHGHIDTNWYVNLHTTISDGTGPLGTGHIRDQWQFAPVPEPASMTLLGAGLMGLGYFGKRRKA